LEAKHGHRPTGTSLIGLDLWPDSTGLVPDGTTVVAGQLNRSHAASLSVDGDVHVRVCAHIRHPVGDLTLAPGAAHHDEVPVRQPVVRQSRLP